MSDTLENDVSDPRIAIGVLSWIEENSQLPELDRCLDSLTDFYPVIVVNGKWSDVEGTNARGTQESQELIDSYSNTIRLDSHNKPEFYNRNLCLIQAGKMLCDYLIWVDSDEYIELPCGISWFKKNLKETFMNPSDFCSRVWFDNGTSRRIIKYPMFIRMRYKHNEWMFNGVDVRKKQLPPIDGMLIHHDKTYRNEERRDKMLNRKVLNPIH